MEVLAGVVAVLVPAVVILVDLAHPAPARPTRVAAPVQPAERAEPTRPATTSLVRVIAALDTLSAPAPERAPEPEPPREPEAPPGSAAETSRQVTVPTPPQTVEGPAVVRPAAFVVRGHAPAFAPAAAPMPVTVRVVPRTPAVTTPAAAHGSGAPAPERAAAPGSVLGVFSDTEPDRGTAAMRRTTSALVLAAVTLFVATGVAGAIYFGLSRLG